MLTLTPRSPGWPGRARPWTRSARRAARRRRAPASRCPGPGTPDCSRRTPARVGVWPGPRAAAWRRSLRQLARTPGRAGGGRVWAQAEHVGRPGACAAAKAAGRPAGARQGGLGRVPHREAHVGRLLALRLWWRVRFKVRGLRERGALRHPGERVARPVRGIHHDPPTCAALLLASALSMGVNQRT